jgi:hypothetical protein
MTREQSRERRQALIALVGGGMPCEEAAALLGMAYNTAYSYTSSLAKPLPAPLGPRPILPPLTPQEQAANVKQASILHAQWRKEHVLLCGNCPKGACCAQCHGSPIMDVIDLPGGKCAYVCCAKASANGYRTQAAVDAMTWYRKNKAAMTAKPRARDLHAKWARR